MTKPLMLITVLSLLNGAAWAQPPATDGTVDWRQANRDVAQFPRGHADVLKWEQANLPPAANAPAIAANLALNSSDAAVRQAWQAHPDLAPALARLGQDNVGRIASGDWLTLNPALSLRIEDGGEVLDIAYSTRKAWLAAVAARQSLQQQRAALDATEAATELAQRMTRVGNWSALQQAQAQAALFDARQQWQRAQYDTRQTHTALRKTLRLWTHNDSARIELPEQLPPLPASILSEAALQARLESVLAVLPRKEKLETRANAAAAYHAYQVSYQLARGQHDDVLKVRQTIYDETVLRYNGMLLNVWQLLAEARSRSLAVSNAITAQRDFWLAEADLQRVLQGGAPDSFISLGNGGNDTAAAAGH